jgi:long-chain acyl-CoA synthetase
MTAETTIQPVAGCRALDWEVAALGRLMADAPGSLGALFLRRAASTPDGEAYRRRDAAGGWVASTWAQTRAVVTDLAAGLLALGLRPEDRVAVASATRLEWIHADLAVMCAGGATTTIYPTTLPADVIFIVKDSGCRFAVVEDAGQLAKVLAEPTSLEKVILIDGTPPAGDERVLSLDGLRDVGRRHLTEHPEAVTEATAAVRPEHLATLIYTSGTTGRPKGVRLSHASWVYEGMATRALDVISPDDLGYLWLPLSHAFGKVLLSTQLATGNPVAIDGDVKRIIENLPVARPTMMAAVPRIFEKVHAGVLAAVRGEGGVKLKIFEWAVGVGLQLSRHRQQGTRPGAVLVLQHRVADRLVLAKVRARFGGRISRFVSGSAALSKDVAEWFHAIGLEVLEGYGLTESAAATFVNRPGRAEFGTVGLPMPGTEVALAEDGEILLRGPGVMMGYHNLPEATAEVLTEDGWLRTGDIGAITARGSLRITDRKKDLIKTSGGKYVAPQAIATEFTAICPLAAQFVVHGEGRNYVTAMVALDPDALAAWAAGAGMTGRGFAEIARSPQLRAAVDGYVQRLNARLGSWEAIKKFEIIDRELTVAEGDLTPSLKLRRRVVEQRYLATLDALYQG